MSSVVSIDPFRVKICGFHNRLETELNEQTCRAEIESFAKHGQLVPAIGRPTRNDPEHDVELVCGARRLFVARHLNVPFLIDVHPMSDQEALVAMDIENRQRQDVSPYERGLAYASWLRAGYFRSQEELAKCIQVSSSQISRLIRVSKLPPVILEAFSSPTHIKEEWGLTLMDLLEDPGRRSSIVATARRISSRASRSQKAREVYRELMLSAEVGRKIKARARDEVVKGACGSPLFRIRHYRDAVAIWLPLRSTSVESLDDITTAIIEALQVARPQTPVSTGEIPADASTELLKSKPPLS
jgi:ParB family transcriptional regulator, chromosome partitioning protein